jgi:ribA/ribD-fused uncharacterized protein
VKTGVVTEFRDEYFFLSNHYTAPFRWRNVDFTSSEQAFVYAKGFMSTASAIETQNFFDAVREAKSPGEAKKLGRNISINLKEWDNQKVTYMREIVHEKFRQVPGLAGQLINTGAMLLVEGNDWNDTFWGRCNGKGFNTLGAILMEERGYWLRSDFNV